MSFPACNDTVQTAVQQGGCALNSKLSGVRRLQEHMEVMQSERSLGGDLRLSARVIRAHGLEPLSEG